MMQTFVCFVHSESVVLWPLTVSDWSFLCMIRISPLPLCQLRDVYTGFIPCLSVIKNRSIYAQTDTRIQKEINILGNDTDIRNIFLQIYSIYTLDVRI